MENVINAFNPSLIVAVVGWWVLLAFSVSRDRDKQRHDLKVRYLIDAYRSLESASGREWNTERVKAVECAVADIQLLRL
ncbi:MAG: hypothetical protein ACM3MG_06735 [Bacillota bacterium]